MPQRRLTTEAESRAVGEVETDHLAPSPTLEIDLATDTAAFEALAGEWDRLVLAADRPSPFLLHGWALAWWRHFSQDASLAVVTARLDDVVVGIAPMVITRRRRVRVCRFLGGHESALGDLLVADPDDDQVPRALMERVRRLPFDYLDAFGIPEAGPMARWCRWAGVTLLRRVESPVLVMHEGWEAAYRARTSSKKRNLHRRRLRQLSEVGEVTWTAASDPDAVTSELDDAFRVHALRWRGRPDGSTFGTSSGRAFHRDAGAALARLGMVRIVTLRIGGEPVAFHYYFILAGTMYVHRLAFDPAFGSRSPGQVTLLQALAAASGEGVTRVEFLGGDERYKVELADRLEPMHQAIGLVRSPVGAVAARMLVWVIRARQRLKRNAWLHDLYTERLGPMRRLIRRS